MTGTITMLDVNSVLVMMVTMGLPDWDELIVRNVVSRDNAGTLVVWGNCDDILHDIEVGISDTVDVLMIS